MERDSALLRRTALTLAAVLAIDLLFAGVLSVLLAPWLTPVAAVGADALGVERIPRPVRLLAILVPGVAVLALLQLRYARRQLLAEADATPVDEASRPDLVARVRRLAALADARPPTVAVADTDVPNAFTVGGVRDATLVVSEGLLDRLDDEELDAVIGHELAHVLNRDAAVLTLASFLPMLADGRSSGVRIRGPGTAGTVAAVAVGYVLAIPVIDAPPFTAAYTGVYAALVLATLLFGGVALGVLALPVARLARRLSREREYAADRAGALLIGSPAAMASALERLDADAPSAPATDERAAVAALCLLPHGFGAARGDGGETGSDDGFVVETRDHPPTEQRLERLRSLTAELET